jgi:DNA-binding NarL/FixJ family response regulator
VPLVIFSENESREEIISALKIGAQGVLYAGMNSELALQAFSFILNGGSYFPSALRPRRPYSQRHPASDCDLTPSCVNGESSAEDLIDADLTDLNLTGRQGAVLELLRRGNSNKVIARRLAMSEGTVKFHVRQIMRKFGVTNRTQVAAVCGAGDEVPFKRNLAGLPSDHINFVEKTFEAAGIEFTNGDQPSVRLKKTSAGSPDNQALGGQARNLGLSQFKTGSTP